MYCTPSKLQGLTLIEKFWKKLLISYPGQKRCTVKRLVIFHITLQKVLPLEMNKENGWPLP